MSSESLKMYDMRKNDPLLQGFIAYPSTATSKIVYISTRPDNRTGSRVILWSDILRYFRHARALMNNKNAVLFLAGADLKDHIPLRIAYHPGVVLRVVVDDDGGDDGQRASTKTLTINSGTLHLGVESSPSGQSLTVRSQGQPVTADSHQGRSGFSTITSSQDVCRVSSHQQVIQLKQEVMMQNEEIRRLRLQLGAWNRQVVIQERVRRLLLETNDLRQCPIPRLFVILPKPKLVDPQENLTTNPGQFRLYFLCECGTHTMTQGCKTPHDVHLAKHGGYDIENPEEFARKYGSHLLTMMYAIKYGVSAAGITVPPLTTPKATIGLRSVLDHSACQNKDTLVDDTISFLQSITGDVEPGIGLDTDEPEACKPEVHKDIDLKELESYLYGEDEEDAPGGLYRVVTSGGIKWVCFDHYHPKYRDSATIHLQDIVRESRGSFNMERGRIVIEIATNTLAKRFYEAMVRVRMIQELVIMLKWNATTEDIQELAWTVTKANVMHLTVDGSYFRYCWRDRVSWSYRLDPIIHLASNGRIQALLMNNCQEFFGLVASPLTFGIASTLRTLDIDGKVPFQESKDSFLSAILDNCPELAELCLQLDQQYQEHWSVSEIVRRLARLENLLLANERFGVKVFVSRGTIQSAAMVVEDLCHITPGDVEFACQGQLDTLMATYTHQESAKERLVEILKQNPGIQSLMIACPVTWISATINLAVSARAEAVQSSNMFTECTFRTMREDDMPTWVHNRPFDKDDHFRTKIIFPANSSQYTMHMGFVMHETSDRVRTIGPEPTSDIILKYGGTLVTFRAPSSFCDHHIELLDVVTELRGSKLEILDVDPTNLSDHGLKCLHRVLERSKNLDMSKMKSWANKWKVKMDDQDVEG